MQNLQDVEEKIFFEAKTILETLCKINSKDELLAKQDLFTEVTDRIAFLRILEKNEVSFSQLLKSHPETNHVDNQHSIIDEATEHVTNFERESAAVIIEEEVIFTNDLNNFEEEIDTQISDEDHSLEETQSNDIEQTDVTPELNLSDEPEIPLIVEQEEEDYADRVAQKERELEEMEERRRKIVEITKHETFTEQSTEEESLPTSLQQAEKKFKLAHIKGLKVVQQIFDNDPLEEELEIKETPPEQGSILKSNIQTDFMEAERKKPEFKLDLNDKVAFTKSLFAGNDEDLKAAIAKLNSFDTLEEAKQYLSEIYYEKNWSTKDEYAQRLWNLVESKFM